MDNNASLSFIRLLANLRWLAVAGQALTVFIVAGPMGFALPQTPLWAGIGALALFNLYATWRSRVRRDASATLVFAHILVPHPPIAFGPNGEPVVVDGCVWTLCTIPDPMTEEFRAAYVGQIEYLNSLVELTAGRIIHESPRPPIVVFFSDHGSRLSRSFDSMFDNLLVSYTPGRRGLLPDDMTPVTMLPRLMNAYLGTSLPLADEQSYTQPAGAFFPVTGPVRPVADSEP